MTGPAWDACDELELEDVATADGVNMILDTLAEAFRVNTTWTDRTQHMSQVKEALTQRLNDEKVMKYSLTKGMVNVLIGYRACSASPQSLAL